MPLDVNDASSLPGSLEIDPVDLGQNVDPARRHPDLPNDAGGLQFLHREAKMFDRHTKANQGFPNTFRIAWGGDVDPQIEITRRTNNSMRRHGVGADDEKPDLLVQKLSQHIQEVAIQGPAEPVRCRLVSR